MSTREARPPSPPPPRRISRFSRCSDDTCPRLRLSDSDLRPPPCCAADGARRCSSSPTSSSSHTRRLRQTTTLVVVATGPSRLQHHRTANVNRARTASTTSIMRPAHSRVRRGVLVFFSMSFSLSPPLFLPSRLPANAVLNFARLPLFRPRRKVGSGTTGKVLTFAFVIILVCFSGLFSGLTLGLLGLDKIGLEIVMGGEDEKLKRFAQARSSCRRDRARARFRAHSTLPRAPRLCSGSHPCARTGICCCARCCSATSA